MQPHQSQKYEQVQPLSSVTCTQMQETVDPRNTSADRELSELSGPSKVKAVAKKPVQVCITS